MILFICALPFEGEPFIRKFQLKRDCDCKSFPLYKSKGITLIISGVGKLKSAIATAYVIGSIKENDIQGIFNIGITGAVSYEYPKGTAVLVNRIIDGDTTRQYYPDILFDHPFKEGSIKTYNQSVDRKDADTWESDLVDMEASGFYQAASSFFHPHQIYIIKVVSDHLEGERLSVRAARECIEKNIDPISQFIEEIKEKTNKEFDIIDNDDRNKLNSMVLHFRFTVSQKNLLFTMARDYKLRYGELPEMDDIMEMKVKTKNDRTKAFERIISKFAL